jgi:hypothetical protein
MNASELSPYIVYYGFARLTKKVVRKRSVAIYYSNCKNYHSERQQRYIRQKMHIVYERFQTKGESEFCGTEDGSNRSWTKWEYFVDDSKWNGNLDVVLAHNYDVEENNVSVEEREQIRQALRKGFNNHYSQYKTARNVNNIK